MANVSEILDSINGNVLTGGRRTKASGVRETLALIAESYLNKEDDANVAGGYLKISDTEIVDVSFIKKTSPTGQFLKDDGTWADAESLNTNTVFLSNDDLTYNSGWADGDTLLAEKNTIYYLQNASPGETLNITIDETDVPVGSMVAFTDGQAAGNGIQGNAVISGAIPGSGGDNQVYSGETVIFRYDGFDWRLMMRYSRNLISQSIASGATRFAPSSDAVFTALAGKVDTTRTITINGVTQNLSANRTWTIDALPSQSGNSGKFLTTNGSVASWASLSSANITDALTYTPANRAGDTLSGFLTLHADPTNSMHAVTKNYVDNLLTGLTWKEKVRVATTANITLSGIQTIDGVSVILGDRVLVKNQSTATQNGIYIVSASTWTRSNDADTGAEILTAAVLVTTGNTQANTQWTCSNSTTPTIGSTNITFAQIAGAGVYTNGTGMSLSGNAFSLDLTRVATSSVTGLLSASDWTIFNSKLEASSVTTEVWNTNANYTITNTTAKILVIEQDGTLTAPRTITLSVLPTGSILVIRGGASITATNVINITGFVNGISTYNPALTLPYQSLVLYSLGGGFYTTNKPQFTETTTALTTSKFLRSSSGIGLKSVSSFTPTWDTGVSQGDLNWNNTNLAILARDGSSNTIPFMPYASFGGWQNYRPTTLQYWNGQNIASGNKPTEYASALGFIYYWNRTYLVQCYGENDDNYLEVLIFVNSTGVPSIIRVLQDSSVFSLTLSSGTLVFAGGNAYVNITQMPQRTTTNLRGSYNWVYQQGGSDVRFQGNLALGSATINSATQIEFQSTTKGAGLNLVTTANLPSFSTRRGNLAFDDTLKTPVISLDRASNATSSWFEIATANRATKVATAADGGAITNWSGNTDYFYTTTVTGAKLGQNVVVNFDATLGALINGTNTVVNSYVSATNTVVIWVRTGTYVPATTLSGNFLISVI